MPAGGLAAAAATVDVAAEHRIVVLLPIRDVAPCIMSDEHVIAIARDVPFIEVVATAILIVAVVAMADRATGRAAAAAFAGSRSPHPVKLDAPVPPRLEPVRFSHRSICSTE